MIDKCLLVNDGKMVGGDLIISLNFTLQGSVILCQAFQMGLVPAYEVCNYVNYTTICRKASSPPGRIVELPSEYFFPQFLSDVERDCWTQALIRKVSSLSCFENARSILNSMYLSEIPFLVFLDFGYQFHLLLTWRSVITFIPIPFTVSLSDVFIGKNLFVKTISLTNRNKFFPDCRITWTHLI